MVIIRMYNSKYLVTFSLTIVKPRVKWYIIVAPINNELVEAQLNDGKNDHYQSPVINQTPINRWQVTLQVISPFNCLFAFV